MTDISERLAHLSPQQRAALLTRLRQAGSGDAHPAGPAPVVAHARTGDTVPLSFTQERIWFLEQFNPGTSYHNMSGVAHLPVHVDPDVFTECVAELVARHEILRTSFAMRDGQPVGVVAGRVDPPVRVLSGDLARDQETVFARDAVQPFDLASAPLLRVTVAPTDDGCDIQMTMHHIVSDGFSTGIFFRELGELYRARLAGLRVDLPALAVQFADFAAAERADLDDPGGAGRLAYWVEHLRGVPQQLSLPGDHARPARMTNRGRRLPVALPDDLVAVVQATSRRLSVTPFVTMLAAYAAVLGRYAAQDDLVVGVPVANREQAGVEQVIGPFLNTLALRVDLSGAPTFAQLVNQVNETVLHGFEHQAVPFERVLHAVQGARDPSRSALIQAAFNFQVEQSAAAAATGTRLRDLHNGGSQFDLLFGLTVTGDHIAGQVDYYADVYEQDTVARLVRSFLTVLRSVATDPDITVDTLPLLPADDLAALVDRELANARAYDRDLCLDELVLAAAHTHPDRIAFIEGGRRTTYGEVALRSAVIAGRLSDAIGDRPGAHVAICLPRSVDTVAAILGVLRAGYAYIALDPGYPAERLGYICEDADIAAVVTRAGVPPVPLAHPVPTVLVDAPPPAGRPSDPVAAGAPDRASQCAYMIYTSGSTGRPKGVRVSHRNTVNFLLSMREWLGMRDTDVLLSVTSPSFDIAVLEMLLPMIAGGRIVMAATHEVTDGRRLAALITEHRVTVMQGTPATWHLLAESGWTGYPGLRVLTGGETLPPALAARLLAGCGAVWNLYGPTETTIYSTGHRVTPEDVARGNIPIGAGIANTTLFVLDKAMQPVPEGVLGELWLGGDGVSIGYHQRPELTAASYAEAPFLPGHRLYRSGDLVRMRAGGELEFAGRRDFQVKVRGFRIELGEIEATLGAHSRVVRAVAVVRQDTGHDASLTAFVEPVRPDPDAAGAEPPTAMELKTFLRQRLPEYMVPARIIILPELPLTPNGKIDRNALPAVDDAGAPEHAVPSAGYVAPVTETEERMTAVWQDILGLPRVGTRDDFFEIGGHSLLATKLIFRIREVFGVDLPLHVLFDGEPTVARLSGLLTDGEPADGGSAPLDLAAEAVLPAEIRPDPGAHVHSVCHPQHALLTGGTGFVGAFLAAELLATTEATLYCLVRAESEEQGHQRIRNTLERYGIWDPAYAERIVAVPGSLSRPHLGLDLPHWQHLAAMVDVIYHCGADVNFVQPYQTLKAANVAGTVEVLRLACEGSTKPVHFVSTTYVFSRFAYPPNTDFAEDDPPVHDLATSFGYTQTKWVSEQMVLEAGRRGLPVYVYRCGRVAGHSRTGACQTYDFVWQVVKVGIEMGVAPELSMSLDITPVDYVVGAMVHLSRRKELAGRAFHLVADHPIPELEFVAWLENYGYGGERVTFPEWCRRVVARAVDLSDETAGALAPFLSGAIPLDRFPPGGFKHDNVAAGLVGTDITCPPIDDRLLRTYFEYFTKIGYLPPPRQPALVGAGGTASNGEEHR